MRGAATSMSPDSVTDPTDRHRSQSSSLGKLCSNPTRMLALHLPANKALGNICEYVKDFKSNPAQQLSVLRQLRWAGSKT